jgi:hypothetical protein
LKEHTVTIIQIIKARHRMYDAADSDSPFAKQEKLNAWRIYHLFELPRLAVVRNRMGLPDVRR